MATKAELLKEAKAQGLAADDAVEEDFSKEELEGMVSQAAAAEGEAPAWEGSLSDHPTPPAPDGHDFNKVLGA